MEFYSQEKCLAIASSILTQKKHQVWSNNVPKSIKIEIQLKEYLVNDRGYCVNQSGVWFGCTETCIIKHVSNFHATQLTCYKHDLHVGRHT
jgi:hypothetical protein